MTRDKPILRAYPSRPVERRAECVLDRGDGIDQVLGDVLRDFPNMSLQEAIEALSAQGW
jgi:hypothetical protein